MQRQFVIARSPDPQVRLPVLLSLPLSPRPLLLATRADWPVDKDLYCHELTEWPAGAEVVECTPVISCQRRGSSIELVLDRPQRRRSLFVFTASRQGNRLVFWRSERSMRSTRPGVRAPQARGLDGPMTVSVDTRERYPWRFTGKPVTLERRRLPAGDYGVFHGDDLVAVAERKKLQEFVGAAVNGQLALALAELSTMPRATVVVEGRLSRLLAADQTRVQPGWLLNLTAALQAAYPNVPILFAETGPLAADLGYRWLAACLNQRKAERRGLSKSELIAELLGERAPAELTAPLFAPKDDAVADISPQQGPIDKRRPAPHVPTRADAPLDSAGRKERAVASATAGERLTVSGHAKACNVSTTTASNDLNELVTAGSLAAIGRGRGRYFVAADSPP